MQIVTQVNYSEGRTEEIVVTSWQEMMSIMQFMILHDIKGQVNLHIQEDGSVKGSKPMFEYHN